jgi:hypothetical protein
MLDQIVGYWRSHAVHVAARLSLADHLAEAPLDVAELAARAQVEARPLYRLLRMLASFGVFTEGPERRFSNTPLSETLREDVPGSMRGFAIMMVDDYNVDAWQGLGRGLATGELPFQQVHGQGPFEYLAANPQKAREFGEAMSSISTMENAAVAEALDLAGVERIVDIGGSHGHMLAAILERDPDLRGVLYDRAEVIENARQVAFLSAPGIAERVELVPGDFFEAVPAGAQAYTMKYILHDWDDERSLQILRNCASAMARDGRVLVVDTVVPAGNEPHWGKLLDINMLVLTGGMERTEAEFAELFAAAGLRLARVIPTACSLSIVEGVLA